MTRRIAMISEHASPLAVLGGVDAGGQNVYVAHVARQLAAAGDRVDVYTRRDGPEPADVVELAPGVRVIHVPAGPPNAVPKEELLPYMAEFRDWMIRDWVRNGRRYDLVHAHFFLSGLVAADLKERLDVPFAITFHALGRVRRQFQGANDTFPTERFAIEQRVAAEADRIIAECPQDREDLIRLYDADPARISIVPCGFDPDEFSPRNRVAARRELDLDPDEPIVLQLGRIVPRKGVDTVIRGVGSLRREHDLDARLLIVGGSAREPDLAGDPEMARLAAIARDEGIADRVTFVGRRDRSELATFYAAADVFVSTPWYEPFGITPVEAMACGTPVIGSDVGGIKFTVRDAETGYLVPSNDPAALADRIARIVGDPAIRLRLSTQAIRRANELFTWRHVTHQVGAIYDEIIATRSIRHDRRSTVRTAGNAALEPARSATRPAAKPAIEAAVR
jgi:D-inositol-3-phosphate glycosyltransferase